MSLLTLMLVIFIYILSFKKWVQSPNLLSTIFFPKENSQNWQSRAVGYFFGELIPEFQLLDLQGPTYNLRLISRLNVLV